MKSFLGLLLLLPTRLGLLRILLGDLIDQFLDLVLLLYVLLHCLLTLVLLHRNLLLINDLDALPLLQLLDVELVLKLNVLKALVLHVLGDVVVAQLLVVLAHVDLHELLRALLVDLRHVEALLEGSQLLTAVADAATVHFLAQLVGLPASHLLGEVLLEGGDLHPARLVLLRRHVLVIHEELAALRSLGARTPLRLHTDRACAVPGEDVVLYQSPAHVSVLLLLLPPPDHTLLDKLLGLARHGP
mmetsp:Transcript_134300/g.388771  ORF Transcript_134300/g.388771 Transcript_134300/m.388771 type:complete len:244 (-) Transcript_134300:89-820(-)